MNIYILYIIYILLLNVLKLTCARNIDRIVVCNTNDESIFVPDVCKDTDWYYRDGKKNTITKKIHPFFFQK